jgi:high-affinity iron transporter
MFFIASAALAETPAVSDPTATDPSSRLLQMLDYVGVDYAPTVEQGEVVNAVEYAEMEEFSAEILNLLAAMPAVAQKPEMQQTARQIREAVERRVPGEQVSALTAQLKVALIKTYALVVAPNAMPAMDQVQALYESNCASCHGAEGRGDGVRAADLEPAPSSFHDIKRQHARSVHDLYNTITLGVPGTPMASFAQLGDDQRWALALMVSRFSSSEQQRQKGEVLWQQGQLNNDFQSIADLTSTSYERAGELGLAAGLTEHDGEAVLSYLRATPEVLEVSDHVALDTSIAKLKASVAYARAGKTEAAHKTALAAYLDGFELAEPSLVVLDKPLKLKIEQAMIEFRELSRSGDVAALEKKQAETVILLNAAKRVLSSSSMSGEAAFTGSFIILAREGVEAILVLAAIMAALIKTGRRDAMKYIHIGWIGAIVLGVLTWWVAENLISISGASRELTEGTAALVAAVILVYVGFWLHNASHSKRWKQFVEHKVSSAMEGRTLWMLALVSFLAVYREMFETVLFYQAMWQQIDAGSEQSFLMGIAAAIVLLIVVAFLIYRVGVRLPIRQFFQINAVLLFALAVIFSGQGIARLQEVGMVNSTYFNFPHIEMLGIYPTVQTLGLQLLVLLIGAGLMLYQRKTAKAQ